MKLSSLVLGVSLCVAQAQAQTNAVRPLTLHQAIELALEHNLDVQIQSYNPLIDRFALQGAYGAYDVTFNVSGQETYTAKPGAFDPLLGFRTPPSETYEDFYKAGFSGLTSWGLNYDLSGTVDRVTGRRFDTNFLPVGIAPSYNNFVGVTLMQPLLRNFWIDQPRRDLLILRKNVRISELGLRQQVISVVTSTEQAYYNLIFAIENVRVQEKALEWAKRLASENKRKVEVGTMAPLDEKQAESQAATIRADLISAQRAEQAQQNVLKSLVTDQYSAWHDVRIAPAEKLIALPEVLDLQESWQRGMAQRPDLLQAKVDLEKRNIDLRFRRNQIFPELDLLGSYGRAGNSSTFGASLDDIRTDQFPAYSYGAQLSVPLSNRAARNAYRGTKAAIQQALLGYKKLEQSILVEIDDTIKLVRANFQRVAATRQASEYAELALNAEQKKLEVGKSTSFVVLQLQRDLTTARSAEIRAVADYNNALSQLAQSEGSTLEKFHLNVKSR